VHGVILTFGSENGKVSVYLLSGDEGMSISTSGNDDPSPIAPENIDDEPPGDAREGPESDDAPKNGRRKRRLLIFGGAAVLGLAVVGLLYWLYARQFESTDDAFVEGDIVQVSPRVSANVSKVHVEGNQFVHAGDLLVELDTKDLEIKLEQAQAQLLTAKSQYEQAIANVNLTRRSTGASQIQARSNVETSRNNVKQTRIASQAKETQVSQAQAALRTAEAAAAEARAQVAQPQADVRLAEVEYERRLRLFNTGDIPRQSVDQALNALQNARSRLSAAQKQVTAAQSRADEARANVNTANENYRQALAEINVTRSQVGESQGRLADAEAAPERIDVSESQVETARAAQNVAEAAVHQAELELSYTKIYAPEDGFVTKKTVEEGQLVQVGMPMMAISQSDDIWVVANFKETQLELMHPGQRVTVKIDAYPSESFNGHVDSVQAGTGSRFSVLPAENATGNFVKVVQRVPVKIVFDEPADKVRKLVPGMSAEPSVKVR
jgi:membrane fusion protein (multidrug efflux system)